MEWVRIPETTFGGKWGGDQGQRVGAPEFSNVEQDGCRLKAQLRLLGRREEECIGNWETFPVGLGGQRSQTPRSCGPGSEHG